MPKINNSLKSCVLRLMLTAVLGTGGAALLSTHVHAAEQPTNTTSASSTQALTPQQVAQQNAVNSGTNFQTSQNGAQDLQSVFDSLSVATITTPLQADTLFSVPGSSSVEMLYYFDAWSNPFDNLPSPPGLYTGTSIGVIESIQQMERQFGQNGTFTLASVTGIQPQAGGGFTLDPVNTISKPTEMVLVAYNYKNTSAPSYVEAVIDGIGFVARLGGGKVTSIANRKFVTSQLPTLDLINTFGAIPFTPEQVATLKAGNPITLQNGISLYGYDRAQVLDPEGMPRIQDYFPISGVINGTLNLHATLGSIGMSLLSVTGIQPGGILDKGGTISKDCSNVLVTYIAAGNIPLYFVASLNNLRKETPRDWGNVLTSFPASANANQDFGAYFNYLMPDAAFVKDLQAGKFYPIPGNGYVKLNYYYGPGSAIPWEGLPSIPGQIMDMAAFGDQPLSWLIPYITNSQYSLQFTVNSITGLQPAAGGGYTCDPVGTVSSPTKTLLVMYEFLFRPEAGSGPIPFIATLGDLTLKPFVPPPTPMQAFQTLLGANTTLTADSAFIHALNHGTSYTLGDVEMKYYYGSGFSTTPVQGFPVLSNAFITTQSVNEGSGTVQTPVIIPAQLLASQLQNASSSQFTLTSVTGLQPQEGGRYQLDPIGTISKPTTTLLALYTFNLGSGDQAISLPSLPFIVTLKSPIS